MFKQSLPGYGRFLVSQPSIWRQDGLGAWCYTLVLDISYGAHCLWPHEPRDDSGSRINVGARCDIIAVNRALASGWPGAHGGVGALRLLTLR